MPSRSIQSTGHPASSARADTKQISEPLREESLAVPEPLQTGARHPSQCDFGEPAPPKLDSAIRSEEHTSELQSPCNLVCRLLLEKKKKKRPHNVCPVSNLHSVAVDVYDLH